MMPARVHRPRLRLAASSTMIVLLLSCGAALAGPAKYDPKTRSFRITYTFAALPSWGMTPDQIEALGELQEPKPDQDAKIRALHLAVSQVLEDITDGRARISSLDYVDAIKKADIVISLTGNFQRAGWSTEGTTDGRPGQVGLYYLYLDSRSTQEVVYTMAHELSHYLFGLPDEYDTATNRPVCPLQNPNSPGCLMDNYFIRHGYRKICRDADHNPDGPRMNAVTILQGTRAEDSCQVRVDNFFKDHPPAPATDSDGDGVLDKPAGSTDAVVTPDEPFTGKFRQVVNSATMAVRDRFRAENIEREKKKQKPLPPDLNRFKQWAKEEIDKQLKELAGDPKFLAPTKDQRERAYLVVAQRVLSDPVSAPNKFNRDVLAQLKAKARELAGTTARPGGDFLRRLFESDSTAATLKALRPVIDKVVKGLKEFIGSSGIRQQLGLAPSDSTSKVLDPATTRFIEQVAREAVTGTSGTTEFSTFLEAAKWQIRLNLNATQTLNAIASELDLPGPEARRLDLKDVQTQLEKYALPGKSFASFGSRRTYVVAPHPLDPRYDRIRLDAGDNLPYHDIRNLMAAQFMRLIQRERTEFVDDPVTPDPIRTIRLDTLLSDIPNPGTGIGTLLDRPARGDRAAGQPTSAELAHAMGPNERFAKQQGLIHKLIEEVRRDRAENIVILAPPDGLSPQLGDVLEDFRSLVLDHANVRVDVVLSDSGNIPLRLRDTVAQTGGSVQMRIDLDEGGAVAQRLETEVAAGSWVSRPQKGYIDFSAGTDPAAAQAARRRDREESQKSFEDLRRDYIESVGHFKSQDFDQLSMDYSKLDALEVDIQAFIGEIEKIFKDGFVSDIARPPSFSSVTATLAGLDRLQSSVKEMRRVLEQIGAESGRPSTRPRIRALLDRIYDAKQDLRPLYGSPALLRSPLTSTDDYMDWTLRKVIVQRAGALYEDYRRSELFRRINEAANGAAAPPDRDTMGHLNEYDLIKDYFLIASLRHNPVDIDRLNRVMEHNFKGTAAEPGDGELQKAVVHLRLWGVKVFESPASYNAALKGLGPQGALDMAFRGVADGLVMALGGQPRRPNTQALTLFDAWRREAIDLYDAHFIDRVLARELTLLSDGFRRVSIKDQTLSDCTSILARATEIYSKADDEYWNSWNEVTLQIREQPKGAADAPQPAQAAPPPAAPSDRSPLDAQGLKKELRGEVAKLERRYEDLERQRAKLNDHRDYVDRLQRKESLLNPDAAPLLLRASDIKIRSLLPVGHSRSLSYTNTLRILDAARLLERASQQPLDRTEFSNQVAALRRYFNNLRSQPQRRITEADEELKKIDEKLKKIEDTMARKAAEPRKGAGGATGLAPAPPGEEVDREVSRYDKMDPDFLNYYKRFHQLKKGQAERAAADLNEYDELLGALEERKEHLVAQRARGEAGTGGAGVRSSLEDDEEEVPTANALSPLAEGLRSDEDIRATLRQRANDALHRARDIEEKNRARGLKFETPNLVRQRVRQLIELEYPLLMLDILGRLRHFEDDIRALERGLREGQVLPPTYQRLTRRPIAPQPDLATDPSGQLLEIPFDPFQAEDGADVELILALSRPLRKFDQLRTDEKFTMRVYQGDRLVSRPYLRFDADRSSEMMLVYRVPIPRQKAGLIGQGEYTPKLLIGRKYLPILSRDYTINYTFSVGTPRPNVQLIAGLRQPQPKEGERQFGEDKKEDAYRGTILSNASEAIAEVQVLAGAPVTRADVTGLFHWVDAGSRMIEAPTVEFVDTGVYPDMKKDDGIYTARITLEPTARRTPAEYRIFVQARWTKDCKFIPLAEPIVGPNEEKKQDPDPPPVPAFQRSTSLNFHVSGET